MLVLTRKSQETVVVAGADVLGVILRVRVLRIKTGSVAPGFDAAADFSVHRLEVWERIRASTARKGNPT